MRVCELAQHLGRTEEQMLDDLDAIGVTAKNGETIVSQSVIERLTKRGQAGASHQENYVDILATLVRSCHGSPLRSAHREDNVEALAAAAGEWTIMKGPDGARDAVIVRYSAEESQRILTRLTTSELAKGSVPHEGNLSATIVDHLTKAAPFVAAGMQVGQVFKVVGTPALVEGLANGSMALMSTAGGSLGTVVSSSTGQIAGQLRFAQASVAPVMAPLLAIQVFQALAGTVQLNRINARLDTMQRSLERIVLRQEAEVLGKANHALRVLEDILQERRTTGTFSQDMLTRLAHVEETIGSIVERNAILVGVLEQKICKLKGARGKDGLAQVNSFVSEEHEQATHDMRLLIAAMKADCRIAEARIYYALEQAPADVERRLENARTKATEYRNIMASLPLLGELQQHARDCIEELSWWERNVTARGVVKEAQRLASIRPDESIDTQGPRASAPQSYAFWKDNDGNVHVKLFAE